VLNPPWPLLSPKIGSFSQVPVAT